MKKKINNTIIYFPVSLKIILVGEILFAWRMIKIIYDCLIQQHIFGGTKSVVFRCSSKQVFLKISLFSQENICVGVYF